MKHLYAVLLGIIFSFLGINIYELVQGKGSAVPYKDIADNHLFLLFPEESASLYETEGFVENLGAVNKAITASKRELSGDALGVILNNNQYFSKPSNFVFYIDDEVKRDKYIERWRENLGVQGYSGGNWEVELTDSGQYYVELSIDDGKHARLDVYRYLTDGKKILSAYPFKTESSIINGGIVILLFFIGFFVFELILRARRENQ